jgi:hypothetical protein
MPRHYDGPSLHHGKVQHDGKKPSPKPPGSAPPPLRSLATLKGPFEKAIASPKRPSAQAPRVSPSNAGQMARSPAQAPFGQQTASIPSGQRRGFGRASNPAKGKRS